MTDVQPPLSRVTVTGAAGLIGRAVTWYLNNLGVPVTGLVLSDPGDLKLDRTVVGTATDRAAVDEALDGSDAIIHLAALAAPSLGTPEEVFCGNTSATFTVLNAAGEHGIRRAVIASSVNWLGYLFSPHPGQGPAVFPVDADTPSVAADSYSLSKVVDETTAAGMHRRYGMNVVALRYPFVGGLGDVPELEGRLYGHPDRVAARPSIGVRDLWLYLESRDAARAAVNALSPRRPGAHAVFVAAPEICAPFATEDLLDAFYPGVPRSRAFPGRTAPIDLAPARELFGFQAEHVVDPPIPPLPPQRTDVT